MDASSPVKNCLTLKPSPDDKKVAKLLIILPGTPVPNPTLPVAYIVNTLAQGIQKHFEKLLRIVALLQFVFMKHTPAESNPKRCNRLNLNFPKTQNCLRILA